ncbi:PAS-domain containing protein [Tistlia consotensis]|uniref:PAS-domain containing protein n=1 Tax=Tistlia consotensis TaxID=1321365 RepID=UPI000A149853|nr:PAS-domain containing protein [Tistlia consotensis]
MSLTASLALPALLVVGLLGGLSLLAVALVRDRPARRLWLLCPLAAVVAGLAAALPPTPGLAESGFAVFALATALAAWSDRRVPLRRRLLFLAGALLLPAGAALLAGEAADGLALAVDGFSSLLLLGAAFGFLAPADTEAERPALLAAGLLLGTAGLLGAVVLPAGTEPATIALLRLGLVAAVPALTGLAALLGEATRLRAEATDNADRLRDLADISSDWLWETDAEHRFTYLSPRLAEVTGLAPRQVLGRTRLELVGASPDDPAWRAHLADLEAHRPFTDFAYDIAVPGADTRTFRISGRPIVDAQGTFKGYRGIGDDLTEIRHAEAALQQLQGRLESAISSLDHGFALFDEDDRLVVFNDAYHRYVPGFRDVLKPGLTYEQILGSVWDLGAYSDSEPDREAFLRRRLERHRDAPYELVQTLSDGTILQMSGLPTKEGGRVVVISDITERRRRERVLETLVRRQEGEATLAAFAEAAAIAIGFRGAGIARRLDDGRVELASWFGSVAPAQGVRLSFSGPGSHHGDPLEEFVGRDADKQFAGCELIGTSGAVAYFCRRLELVDGTVIGYLIALDDRPHDGNPANPELLRLVARGASLELRRLQAEEALRLSEQRFRDIADMNSDWIWETDADHRYTYFSPRFATVTGLPVERALGLTRVELVQADTSDPAWQAHLADLAAHRDVREFIYTGKVIGSDKPGRYRINGKAIFDEQGTFLGYRGTANDVTEIVETRAAAETLRLQLQAAVASLPDGFALFDPEERLVICNEVYRQVSPTIGRIAEPGASFEAIVRAAMADGLFDLQGADPEAFVAERVARHRDAPYRLELNYADGRVVQVSGARTPDGGSVLLWTDIGVHVRRERVLSILVESRTRGRDLLEAAAEALQVGLGYRWAGVARRASEAGQAEVLAMWDGRLPGTIPPFLYDLAGSPCDQVYNGRQRCFWPRDVAARFPQDTVLAEMGAEAYRGHLLLDSQNRVLGHIFAIGDEPAPSRAGDDDIVQMIANAVTIELQRLQAAQERDRAADLLRIIFENMRAGITVVDRDLRVIGYNDRFHELLQFPDEVLASGSFEAMVRYNAERGEYGPGDVDEQVRQRVELARRFEAHRFERQRPDGRYIEVRGDPLPGGGFVTTYTDVTDRRRIEDALRQNELRYRLISEMTSDLLYSFRIEEDGTPVAEWSAGSVGNVALDLLDHGVPGSAWNRLIGVIHPDDRELSEERHRRLFAGEQSVDELRVLLPDGRVLWVRVHCRPEVDPETGRTVRIIGAAQDITERRQAEAELRGAMETAELANRTKSEFLANMSHELRTPLNAIIGFSEVMAQELLGPLGDGRYRTYAQDIRDSGTHLLDIINDILDVSKAEAGMLELAEEPIELADAVTASLRLISQRAERGGVRLRESVPQELPPLLADPRRLKQILINLLSNAVKFTPAGGTVSVEAWQEAEGELAIRIADTGIGIKPEDLARVLEPFTQADSGFNRRHEGTGLGLPLTKALVELHGGRLELSGNEGGGTRAVVRFPAGRALPRTRRRLTSAGAD